MTAFAMFHLKDPSLLFFQNNFDTRRANLEHLYGIETIYSDTAIREAIDGIAPEDIKHGFGELFEELEQTGVLAHYKVLGGYYCCAVDGTQHYCSGSTSCPHCLEKTTSGKTNYHHQALVGVVVKNGQKEVFPVACEAIVKQDGKDKNDCELNAAHRLMPQIRSVLPATKYKLIGLFDGLYPNGNMIRNLQAQAIRYIMGIKEGYVLVQVGRLRQDGALAVKEWNNEKGHRCRASWRNGLILNGQHQDILVNYYEFEEYNKKGERVYRNTWITDLDITQVNIVELVTVGRSRWKIENETFNTLKTQGYHLEHNYGHGKKNLATNFMLLTFLAFLIDQIAQSVDVAFKKALNFCHNKKSLWEAVRSAFYVIPCRNWEQLYRIIANEVKFKIVLLE